MPDKKKPPEIRIDALQLQVWDKDSKKDVTAQVGEALAAMPGEAGKVVTGKPAEGFLITAGGSVDYDEKRAEVAVEIKLLVKRHDNRLVGSYKAGGKIGVRDASRLEGNLRKLIGLVVEKLGKQVLPDLAE